HSRSPPLCYLLTVLPHPDAPLFPYTTLFRSARAGGRAAGARARGRAVPDGEGGTPGRLWRRLFRFSSGDLERGGKDAAISGQALDRKSTRLNSSHVKISYAVFCLKKKNQETA